MDADKQNPKGNGSQAGAGDGVNDVSIESAYGSAGGAGAAGGSGTESKPEAGSSAGTEKPEEPAKLAAWAEQLTDDLKGNPETAKRLAKFQRVGDLAKSYLELETKLGAAVTIPGKDASDEERAAFRKKLGVPEDKAKYSIAKQQDAQAFVDVAHAAGLTDAQASEIYEANRKSVAERMAAFEQAQREQLATLNAALKAEYGGKFSEKVERARRGLAIAGPEASAALRSAGLAYHPGIVKAFIQLGESVAEPFAPRTGGSAGGGYKGARDGGRLYDEK